MALPELFSNPPTPGGSVPWVMTTLGANIGAGTPGVSDTLTFAGAPPAGLTGNGGNGQFRFVIDSEIFIDITGSNSTTRTVIRGAEGSTSTSHSAGAPIYHILTAGSVNTIGGPLASTVIQPGIVDSGVISINQISCSINGTTGAITIVYSGNTTGNPYWMKSNTTGLLYPVYLTGNITKTITPGTLPAASQHINYLIGIDDQGNLDIENQDASTAGTQTSFPLTSSLLATTALSNSPRLPFALVSIYNAAGVYKWGNNSTTFTQGVNWLDLRPWAVAASGFVAGSTSGPTNGTTAAQLAEMVMRLSIGSSSDVDLRFNGQFSNSVAGSGVGAQFYRDGVAIGSTRIAESATAGNNVVIHNEFVDSPSGGSHLYEVRFNATTSGTATATTVRRQFVAREVSRSSGSNGIA